MKKTFDKLNVDVYEEVLDNGLHLYICPLNRHEAHARIVTRYGSSTLEFKPEGKNEFVKIPEGTAHFLEHKMFAMEDGTDVMDVFQKNGAINNAYTNAFQTVYYYLAPNHFFENLRNLLECVTKPYYTKENVEKEMGIIDQEIKAGFDNPGNMAYYTTIHNTFCNLPFRYPVAGYSESIKKITPEILYDCYNTFYHPSNMSLIITGNVSVSETINFVKDYFADRDYDELPKIVKKKYDEPRKVFKKKEIVNRKVNNQIIEMAYKLYIGDSKLSLYKILSYIDIYLDIKFGVISSFNKKAFKDKNILSGVRYNLTVVDDYLMVDFDTMVVSSDNIFELIDNNVNDGSFSKEDFDLIKKNAIKSFILSTENVYGLANMIDYQLRQYNEVKYSMYDEIQSLDYDECLDFVKNIDFSNYTMTVVKR